MKDKILEILNNNASLIISLLDNKYDVIWPGRFNEVAEQIMELINKAHEEQ